MLKSILVALVLLPAIAHADAADSGKKKPVMKKFVDIHRGLPKNLTPEQTAADHKKDVDVAKAKHPNVHYTRYWYDKDTGVLFCECESPTMDECVAVHKEAHDGHGADEIHEVVDGK